MHRGKPAERPEAGFVITEVTVAITILAVVVLGIGASMSGGLRALLTAKQRIAAVNAANAMLEQARSVASVDWSQLGLVPGDVSGDPNVVSGPCGASPSVALYAGEPIVEAGGAGTNPLSPHIRQTTAGGTTVTLKTYVTGVSDSGCSAASYTTKRVTVLGSWSRAQDGVRNEVRLATYVFDALATAANVFEATAAHTAGYLKGTLDDPASISTVYLPHSSADARVAGRVQVAKGSGIAALGEVDGSIVGDEHKAVTLADDDGLTAAGPGTWPNPNCDSGAWSETIGGLINGTLLGAASSCSSVASQDGKPNALATASMTGMEPMVSHVPAGPGLPGFPVTNYSVGGVMASASEADRFVVSSLQRTLARSTLTTGGVQMMRFALLGFDASEGAISLGAGAYSAEVRAGQGTAANPVMAPVLSGVVTYKLYDPYATMLVCDSRSGSYCVKTIDPAAAGFPGHDETHTVVLVSGPSRITVTSRIIVHAPVRSTSLNNFDVESASATFPLPKVISTMHVESPIGTTLATISDDADFGQLVVAAAYRGTP